MATKQKVVKIPGANMKLVPRTIFAKALKKLNGGSDEEMPTHIAFGYDSGDSIWRAECGESPNDAVDSLINNGSGSLVASTVTVIEL